MLTSFTAYTFSRPQSIGFLSVEAPKTIVYTADIPVEGI